MYHEVDGRIDVVVTLKGHLFVCSIGLLLRLAKRTTLNRVLSYLLMLKCRCACIIVMRLPNDYCPVKTTVILYKNSRENIELTRGISLRPGTRTAC